MAVKGAELVVIFDGMHVGRRLYVDGRSWGKISLLMRDGAGQLESRGLRNLSVV